MTDEDFSLFREYSEQSKNVRELSDWFGSLKVLTEEEIKSTWNSNQYGEFTDIVESYARHLGFVRMVREYFALRPTSNRQKEPSDEFVDILNTFSGWKNAYEKSARQKRRSG